MSLSVSQTMCWVLFMAVNWFFLLLVKQHLEDKRGE